MRSIADLLQESETIEERASALQEEGHPVELDAVREVEKAYRSWYASCLAVLPPELKERFRGEYEGGIVSMKIKAYLGDPARPSALWKPPPAENLPGLSRWQHPFDAQFRNPMAQQRMLLAEAAAARAGPDVDDDVVLVLERLSRRITDIVHPLTHRRKGKPTFEIGDEYDLQDVVHALLLARFADVRAEERGPSQSGASATIDFLLKVERIAVETKMTRPSLGGKDVGDEILADAERYRRHPDVDALVVLVYDPARHIGNAAPLERDLSRDHDGLRVEVWVAR